MRTTTVDITQLSPEQRTRLELRLNQRRGKGTSHRILRRADPGAPFPLSFNQQRLWVTHQLHPWSSADNISGGLRLLGEFDRGAFERSLQEIVRRHEVLRTRFLTVEDEPVQCVDSARALDVPFLDLRNQPEFERNAHVLRLAEEDARRPFDLGRESLMRAQLLRVSDEEHVLLLSMHHIVSDGWSLNVLFRELSVLYSSFKAGRKSPLAELPIQYGDFVLWQRQHLRDKVLEDKLSYWTRQLAGVPVLELPLDRPRPAVQTLRGGRASIALSRTLTDGLKRLSEQEGTSLFMTLIGAFKVLLARYANQHDIAVGTSIAGRNHVESEGLIGCFMNLVVIRTSLVGEPSFREVLRRVREAAVGAYDHQDLPFLKLVEALQPARTLSHTPFFQVTFELQNRQGEGVQLPGLVVLPLERALDSQNNAAKYDMSVVLSDTEQGLRGFVLYNTDLFNSTTIERMIVHFQTLLGGMVEDPDQHISRLPLLTNDEFHWYVTGANGTRQDIPVGHLHRMFEAQVVLSPDAVSVKFGNQHLTYRELNRRANQLAHYLRSLSIGPEALVGVFMRRSLDMMIALLGVLKAGAAYVPLDPTYPAERLAFMRDDSNLQVLLTEDALAGLLAKPGVRTICLDTSWHDAIAGQHPDNPPGNVEPLGLAYVIYTSGSTGRPKGVMITHLGIANYVGWAADAYRAVDGRGALVHSPIGFDMTLTGLFPPLQVGKTVELLPEAPGIEALEQALRSHGCFSLLKITPAHLELLNRQLPAEKLDRRAGTLVVGADALFAPALASWRTHATQTRIINEYGPTETVVGCSVYQISEDSPTSGGVAIGLPIANMRMYVLDRRLQPVPIGVAGELYIGGVGVARGYLNRPDLTAQRFLPDPVSDEPGARLYRAGDVARYLPDKRQHIEFLGRIDNQVKLRGFRIELGEIEAVLLGHAAVREAVVVQRADAAGDKHLVAYVVASSNQQIVSSELREFLKEQLPDYMVPASFVVLDALPLTPNGKVDRNALPAFSKERQDSPESIVQPRDGLERRLVELWEEILDVHPVGVTDNFFEIGGHSLLAERVTAKIRQQFGKAMTLSSFLQGPTVEQVAAVLRQQDERPSLSALVALKPEGALPPFFCVHSLSGEATIFAELARHLGPDQPLYGLQAPHPVDIGDEVISVEEMATQYVEAITSVQPHGPYYIGGYSFGCPIAFEMAQRLRDLGHQVGLVALFDGISPLSIRGIGDRGDAVTFAGIARDWARVTGVNLSLPHEEVKGLGSDEGLKRILAKISAANLLEPGQGIEWARRFLKGIKARTRAVQAYRPRVYDGVITLFRSTEVEPESAKALLEIGVDVLDPQRGWDKLCSRPLDLHFLPGHHATLLRQPLVQAVAEELTACLANARKSAQTDSRGARKEA